MNPLFYILYLIFAMFVCLWLGWIANDTYKRWKDEDAEENQAIKSPGQKDELEYLKICGYDPKECAEHHLPGDCPLCGAN